MDEPFQQVDPFLAGDAPCGRRSLVHRTIAHDVEPPRLEPSLDPPLGEHLDRELVARTLGDIVERPQEAQPRRRRVDARPQGEARERTRGDGVRVIRQQGEIRLDVGSGHRRPHLIEERTEVVRGHRRRGLGPAARRRGLGSAARRDGLGSGTRRGGLGSGTRRGARRERSGAAENGPHGHGDRQRGGKRPGAGP